MCVPLPRESRKRFVCPLPPVDAMRVAAMLWHGRGREQLLQGPGPRCAGGGLRHRRGRPSLLEGQVRLPPAHPRPRLPALLFSSPLPPRPAHSSYPVPPPPPLLLWTLPRIASEMHSRSAVVLDVMGPPKRCGFALSEGPKRIAVASPSARLSPAPKQTRSPLSILLLAHNSLKAPRLAAQQACRPTSCLTFFLQTASASRLDFLRCRQRQLGVSHN